ncbi:hypothetical protein [Synechococcus sp. PCC 7336]|uniref:DUF7919 family protein n=1 Tax=Synechococcus sp. PCC 7336 TaxID=195250 RepID=UPI00036B9E51|nr:hypothetical protein [Synechococcus sp. PCC 7336]
MYYPDLSCYRVEESEGIAEVYPEVKNIGWLWEGIPFPKGSISPHLVQKLKEMLFLDLKNDEDKKNKAFYENKAILIHQMYIRGRPHLCNICQNRKEIWIEPNGLKYYSGTKSKLLGHNEICIPSLKEREFYVFPTMLYHYICVHNYLPPKEFLDALNEFDLGKPYNADKAQGDLVYLKMPSGQVNSFVP